MKCSILNIVLIVGLIQCLTWHGTNASFFDRLKNRPFVSFLKNRLIDAKKADSKLKAEIKESKVSLKSVGGMENEEELEATMREIRECIKTNRGMGIFSGISNCFLAPLRNMTTCIVQNRRNITEQRGCIRSYIRRFETPANTTETTSTTAVDDGATTTTVAAETTTTTVAAETTTTTVANRLRLFDDEEDLLFEDMKSDVDTVFGSIEEIRTCIEQDANNTDWIIGCYGEPVANFKECLMSHRGDVEDQKECLKDFILDFTEDAELTEETLESISSGNSENEVREPSSMLKGSNQLDNDEELESMDDEAEELEGLKSFHDEEELEDEEELKSVDSMENEEELEATMREIRDCIKTNRGMGIFSGVNNCFLAPLRNMSSCIIGNRRNLTEQRQCIRSYIRRFEVPANAVTDGATTTTAADGASTTTAADGASTTTAADGATTTTAADGASTTTAADGATTTTGGSTTTTTSSTTTSTTTTTTTTTGARLRIYNEADNYLFMTRDETDFGTIDNVTQCVDQAHNNTDSIIGCFGTPVILLKKCLQDQKNSFRMQKICVKDFILDMTDDFDLAEETLESLSFDNEEEVEAPANTLLKASKDNEEEVEAPANTLLKLVGSKVDFGSARAIFLACRQQKNTSTIVCFREKIRAFRDCLRETRNLRECLKNATSIDLVQSKLVKTASDKLLKPLLKTYLTAYQEFQSKLQGARSKRGADSSDEETVLDQIEQGNFIGALKQANRKFKLNKELNLKFTF